MKKQMTNSIIPQSTLRTMPSDEGMAYVCRMVTGSYIAHKSGKKPSVISCGINHTTVHDAPYYFRRDDIETYNRVIEEVALELLRTSVVEEPTTEGFAAGTGYVEKFHNLRKVVKLNYIFQTILGKTSRWQKMRVSEKGTQYYGNFTPEEIAAVNNAIRTIAIELLSIRLEYVEPEGTNE